ncbi:MAG TPA: hypothetical protein VK882_07250 [Nitrososphaeraceae archaeon]|nr:hypothetical protein [Nitrososphaeraceae archaeon]
MVNYFFVFVPISILSIILINKKINIPDEKILINENTESIDTLTNKKLSKLNLIDFKGTITLALLISSFLIVLSNLKEFDPRQFQLTVIFTIITLISLILFIFFLKRNKNSVISVVIFKTENSSFYKYHFNDIRFNNSYDLSNATNINT